MLPFALRHRLRVWFRMAGALARDPYVVVPIPVGPLAGGTFAPVGMTHDTYRAFVHVEEWLRLHEDAVESDRFERFHREILQLAEHGRLGPPAVYMLQHPEGFTDWDLVEALEADDDLSDAEIEEIELDLENEEKGHAH